MSLSNIGHFPTLVLTRSGSKGPIYIISVFATPLVIIIHFSKKSFQQVILCNKKTFFSPREKCYVKNVALSYADVNQFRFEGFFSAILAPLAQALLYHKFSIKCK